MISVPSQRSPEVQPAEGRPGPSDYYDDEEDDDDDYDDDDDDDMVQATGKYWRQGGLPAPAAKI